MGKKKKSKSGYGKTNWTDVDVLVGPIAKEDGPKRLEIRQGEETLIVTCTKRLYDYCLHYVDYPDLKSYGPYVHCNAPGGSCLLCQVGKPVVKRYLTPVFSIEAGDIRILTISPSLKPFALLPQWGNIFINKGIRHHVAIVRDESFKYLVSPLEFETGMKDQIEPIIKDFKRLINKDEVDIGSVYPHVSNKTLAELPEISRILAAKGISPQKTDAVDDDDI